MKSQRPDHLLNLGILLGLGLSLAFVGCGEDEATGSSAASSSAASSTSSAASSTSGAGSSSSSSTGGGETKAFSFFVSSTGSTTGNLGGLAGADKRCQDLATAVSAGAKTWHAYLSVEKGANGQPENAKDRIGSGPWYNAKLALVATDVKALHERFGDYTVFLDEKGEPVPGQWASSPTPVQHDVLTGTNRDGTLIVGKTCADWTSESATLTAVVGHTDGLGPMMNMADMYRPWNFVHENGGCNDTAPKGGNGRIYCFATN